MDSFQRKNTRPQNPCPGPSGIKKRKILSMAERSDVPKFFNYNASQADEKSSTDVDSVDVDPAVEAAIEHGIAQDYANGFHLPLTPESPLNNPFKIEAPNDDLVCRVLPIMLGYSAVKITKVVESNLEKSKALESSSRKGRKIEEYTVKTELIPTFSPYWLQYIHLARRNKDCSLVKEKSIYDNVMVSVRRDKKGQVFALRECKYALILRDPSDGKLERYGPVAKVYHEKPSEVKPGVLPTDQIPVDSPYYAVLMVGLYFPKFGHKWYSRRAQDGVRVAIRLDSQRRIFIKRNGITVMIYNGINRPPTSTIRHISKR